MNFQKSTNFFSLTLIVLVLPLLFTLLSTIMNDLKFLSTFFIFAFALFLLSYASKAIWKRGLKYKKNMSKVNIFCIFFLFFLVKYGVIAVILIFTFIFDKDLSWEVGIALTAFVPIFFFALKVRESNELH